MSTSTDALLSAARPEWDEPIQGIDALSDLRFVATVAQLQETLSESEHKDRIIEERDITISQKDCIISQKEAEILVLKSQLSLAGFEDTVRPPSHDRLPADV